MQLDGLKWLHRHDLAPEPAGRHEDPHTESCAHKIMDRGIEERPWN
jgi:hypothetical protein